jgi:DNA-binding CsgD family transcriptional regulator
VDLIDLDRAKSAADALLAAALLGDDWADGLQQLADAVGAGGATLTRVRGGRAVAALASTGWVEAEAALVAGHAPPSPRMFFPERVPRRGFLGDTDFWTADELRRDPYFQEFLRPRGVFYHAKARMLADPCHRLSLTLKRLSKFGPYESAEIAALDWLLPGLHMAVRITQRGLDAEASGMARVLHDRGDPVFDLDSWARVLRVRGDDTEDLGVAVRQRRLLATERLAQATLDRAVAAAVRPPQKPALVAVTNERGERRFVHVIPLTGRARDVFLATAALVVVIDPGRAEAGPLPGAIRQALGLTEREAQVAALLAEGSSLRAIAERLHVGLGTVRNHVKSIFGKTDTRRQGELVALLRTVRL